MKLSTSFSLKHHQSTTNACQKFLMSCVKKEQIILIDFNKDKAKNRRRKIKKSQ